MRTVFVLRARLCECECVRLWRRTHNVGVWVGLRACVSDVCVIEDLQHRLQTAESALGDEQRSRAEIQLQWYVPREQR